MTDTSRFAAQMSEREARDILGNPPSWKLKGMARSAQRLFKLSDPGGKIIAQRREALIRLGYSVLPD
ncbi:MAG: hypothetical protein ABUJ98_14745 [Hyphomicrobium sp.]